MDPGRLRAHALRWFATALPAAALIAAMPAMAHAAPLAGALGTEESVAAQAAAGPAARFVPLSPRRVLDTRIGLGADGPLPADGTVTLDLAGNGDIPAGAAAVAMNVTVTETHAAGYVTVWPAGELRPEASNLNAEHAGQTIANSTVARVGANGAVSIYSQSPTHLVADVTGYWMWADASSAGRIRLITPARMVDTRTRGQMLASDGTLRVGVAGQADIPADASAVVVNLTATETTGAGYLTAWGSGDRPLASALNTEQAGQTIANLAVVPVAADGTIAVFAQTATHVIVDVFGWITGGSTPAGSDGLLVPVTPSRVLDTRLEHHRDGVYRDGGSASLIPTYVIGDVSGLPRSRRVDLDLTGTVPAGAGAVLANLTATESAAAGFVAVWPAGTTQPATSNLNTARPDQTIANLAVSRLGHDAVSLYTSARVDLAVDVTGWILGPQPGPDPAVTARPLPGRPDGDLVVSSDETDPYLDEGGGPFPYTLPAGVRPDVSWRDGAARGWHLGVTQTPTPVSIATVADMIAAQAHADGWLLGTQASSWTVGDLPNQMRSGTQIWWLPYPADPGVVVTGVRACFTRGTDILTLIISGGHIDTLNGDRYVAGIDVATGPAHTFTWNCR